MRNRAATSVVPRNDEPPKSQLQKNLSDLQSLNITDTDTQRDEVLTLLASTLNTFMQTCKVCKVKKGKLFKRTKELGYKRRYAKKNYWILGETGGEMSRKKTKTKGKRRKMKMKMNMKMKIKRKRKRRKWKKTLKSWGDQNQPPAQGKIHHQNHLQPLIQCNMTEKWRKKMPRKRRCF